MAHPSLGQEWLVDASGCRPAALRDKAALQALFAELVAALGLTQLGEGLWHVFPGEGGITGLVLLSESHLAIHTFPEHGAAALSVYSCRPRPAPRFEAVLRRHLEPSRVVVQTVERAA